MLEIVICFPEKEDADKFNYDVRSFFQGSKAFQNDDIIVTPVYSNWYKKQKYFFAISLVDENVNSRIIIEDSGITIMEIEKLWNSAKEDCRNKELKDE